MDALIALEDAQRHWASGHADIACVIATDHGKMSPTEEEILHSDNITLRAVVLDPKELSATGGQNQMPVVLVFREGRVAQKYLGARSADELVQLIAE